MSKKYHVIADQAKDCLAILEKASTPIIAVDLAVRLGIYGKRETVRRRVRHILKHLRDNGCWIVATNLNGSWLTEDETVWRDYLKGRQIDSKRILGEMHKRERALNEAQQMPLFQPPIINQHMSE